MDEPGAGGAYHRYIVADKDLLSPTGDKNFPVYYADISFQKGPVNESGVNGIFIEDLLQICRHRLQCFQDGDFKCRENALALTKIEEALHWLDHRTKDRQQRGVEGTSEK
jgi:hypothetical protein